MRENCTSGLMSGEGKRSALQRATAPFLDSTHPLRLAAMSESARTRRVIALAAAYVVALQALLLPMSVAAGGPFESSLCAAAAPVDGSPSPAATDIGNSKAC